MPKLTPRAQKIANELAAMPEVKGLATPPAIKTTQDHYGYYAGVISQLADLLGDGSKGAQIMAAEALKLAGGNAKGIDNAMFAMFGHAEYDPMARMFA